MATDVNKDLLQQFRWFQKLSEEEADQAADDISAVPIKAGEVLFKQGEAGNSMFMVLSGSVTISMELPNGESHALGVLEGGGIFGEMSLLLGEPRNATAVATADGEVCCITHDDFNESLETGEAWASKFLMAMTRSLARRLSVLDADLAKLLGKEAKQPEPAPARVAELEKLRGRLLSEWKF